MIATGEEDACASGGVGHFFVVRGVAHKPDIFDGCIDGGEELVSEVNFRASAMIIETFDDRKIVADAVCGKRVFERRLLRC